MKDNEVKGSVITHCDCISTYQDHAYGKGNRVANYAPKSGPGKSAAYRCANCGKLLSGR